MAVVNTWSPEEIEQELSERCEGLPRLQAWFKRLLDTDDDISKLIGSAFEFYEELPDAPDTWRVGVWKVVRIVKEGRHTWTIGKAIDGDVQWGEERRFSWQDVLFGLRAVVKSGAVVFVVPRRLARAGKVHDHTKVYVPEVLKGGRRSGRPWSPSAVTQVLNIKKGYRVTLPLLGTHFMLPSVVELFHAAKSLSDDPSQHFQRSEDEMVQEVVAYLAEFPFLLRCVGCCKDNNPTPELHNILGKLNEMDEQVAEPRSDRECEGGNVTWRRANKAQDDEKEDDAQTTEEDSHTRPRSLEGTEKAAVPQSMERKVQARAEEKKQRPQPAQAGRRNATSNAQRPTGKGKHYVRTSRVEEVEKVERGEEEEDMVAPGCGAIGGGEKGGEDSREVQEESPEDDTEQRGGRRGRKRGAAEAAVDDNQVTLLDEQREREEEGAQSRPQKRRSWWERITGLWHNEQSA